MAKVGIDVFSGIVPRIDKRLLSDSSAQSALNCSIKSGKLVPFLSATKETDVAAGTLTVYPYNSAWLTWTNRVSVAPGMVVSDAYNRIYYTGDGSKPKIRLISGTEQERNLGVPKPTNTPSIVAQAPSSVSWTREWHYQYEEADTSVSQTGDLTEGAYSGNNINEVIPGESYRMFDVPARVTATSTATLVIFCELYDSGGAYLGRIYSDISNYDSQSDAFINGAQVSIAQVNSSSSPKVTMTFNYDTSRISDYVRERSYVYTLVSDLGEEGPPSTAATEISVSPNEEVVVSNLDAVAPADYPNISLIRIYRTATSSAGTFYYFVAEISFGTASYTDTLTDSSLGETLATEGYFPPDDDLDGLIALQSGIYVGFVGKTAKHSYAYLPYAWNTAYDIEAKSTIKAVIEAPGGYYILTTDQPEMIQGNSPENIVRYEIPFHQGCASAYGAVKYEGSVLYPSPDGIVSLTGLTPQLITNAFFTREQWLAFSPSTMVGAIHDGRYHLVSENTHLIYDIEAGIIVTCDVLPTGFYVDNEIDLLYYIAGTELKKWGQGATYMTMTWRSKEFTFPANLAPIAVRVDAEVYPVTMRFRANDAQVLEVSVTSDKARKIPFLRRERYWAVEVESSGQINSVRFGSNIGEVSA